jgi:hypothetical protein
MLLYSQVSSQAVLNNASLSVGLLNPIRRRDRSAKCICNRHPRRYWYLLICLVTGPEPSSTWEIQEPICFRANATLHGCLVMITLSGISETWLLIVSFVNMWWPRNADPLSPGSFLYLGYFKREKWEEQYLLQAFKGEEDEWEAGWRGGGGQLR